MKRIVIEKVISHLRNMYPSNLEPGFSSDDRYSPFQILIGTILSQRTRDASTSKACRRLFKLYGTPDTLATAPVDKIEKLIMDVGFYKIKSKRIKEVADIIHKKFDDEVPKKMDELLSLPGVGRKTANCVMVYGYNMPAIPVDTHVHRISNRLGFVHTQMPEETEIELMKVVPEKLWLDMNRLFIKFGQDVCRPIAPTCESCTIRKYCRWSK